MLGELYRPRGLALETARAVLQVDNVYAINVASGCDGECGYCYIDKYTHAPKGTMRFPKEKPAILIQRQLDKGVKPDGVFFCFLTDPFSEKNRASTEEAIKMLQEAGIDNIATLSKMGIVDWRLSPIKNGMTIVSFDKEFWQKWEKKRLNPYCRIAKLDGRKYMEGDESWISMEPVPVTAIHKQNFSEVLGHFRNVDFIVFGKWNYNKLAETEQARQEYAEDIATFIDFCKTYGIRYHIKSDTLKFAGVTPS